jgi:hypothetical protein
MEVDLKEVAYGEDRHPNLDRFDADDTVDSSEL